METLRVSTKSNPNAVAGAIAGILRSDRVVQISVVGAGALNQAVKALCIAREHVAGDGIDAVCIPSFGDIEIEGEQRTAIMLRVEHRVGDRDASVIDLRPDPVPTAELG